MEDRALDANTGSDSEHLVDFERSRNNRTSAKVRRHTKPLPKVTSTETRLPEGSRNTQSSDSEQEFFDFPKEAEDMATQNEELEVAMMEEGDQIANHGSKELGSQDELDREVINGNGQKNGEEMNENEDGLGVFEDTLRPRGHPGFPSPLPRLPEISEDIENSELLDLSHKPKAIPPSKTARGPIKNRRIKKSDYAGKPIFDPAPGIDFRNIFEIDDQPLPNEIEMSGKGGIQLSDFVVGLASICKELGLITIAHLKPYRLVWNSDGKVISVRPQIPRACLGPDGRPFRLGTLILSGNPDLKLGGIYHISETQRLWQRDISFEKWVMKNVHLVEEIPEGESGSESESESGSGSGSGSNLDFDDGDPGPSRIIPKFSATSTKPATIKFTTPTLSRDKIERIRDLEVKVKDMSYRMVDIEHENSNLKRKSKNFEKIMHEAKEKQQELMGSRQTDIMISLDRNVKDIKQISQQYNQTEPGAGVTITKHFIKLFEKDLEDLKVFARTMEKEAINAAIPVVSSDSEDSDELEGPMPEPATWSKGKGKEKDTRVESVLQKVIKEKEQAREKRALEFQEGHFLSEGSLFKKSPGKGNRVQREALQALAKGKRIIDKVESNTSGKKMAPKATTKAPSKKRPAQSGPSTSPRAKRTKQK